MHSKSLKAELLGLLDMYGTLFVSKSPPYKVISFFRSLVYVVGKQIECFIEVVQLLLHGRLSNVFNILP